jgi:hypothetical protein
VFDVWMTDTRLGCGVEDKDQGKGRSGKSLLSRTEPV